LIHREYKILSIFNERMSMRECKTLYVELFVNVETDKYRDMNQLIKRIKNDFYIEQLILSDEEIEIDYFQVTNVMFHNELPFSIR
jgi:hypothetical protein